MLGEIYQPAGKALEHAQAVLETQNAYAVNVALGCKMGCSYCYGPGATYQNRESWRNVRYPTKSPRELVRRQLDKGLRPDGVFISFFTEPLHPKARASTEELANFLLFQDVKVAISSKLGVASVPGVRHGMTVVSVNRKFSHDFEGVNPPPQSRINTLRTAHELGEYTWASLEPLPCPAIWDQDILEVLQKLHFVDFLILGKWNYDKRSSTKEARAYYRDAVHTFRDFCAEHGIRNHVKVGTLKFVEGI